MPRKPHTPLKDFFWAAALLSGVGLLYLALWCVVLLIIAGLIFLGLTVFTNWNMGVRIAGSLFASFVAMKLLGGMLEILDMIPQSWIDGNKKTKPCPQCGKNLRTAMAQQCMHCGADWHL